jgi:hypothetical protein
MVCMIECRYQNILNSYVGQLPFLRNSKIITYRLHMHGGGARWRSWLRHCATSRKVVGLIPDGVTGIFSLT